MLSEWQIILLDNGLWLVPLMGIAGLVVFPWKHWNSLLVREDERRYTKD